MLNKMIQIVKISLLLILVSGFNLQLKPLNKNNPYEKRMMKACEKYIQEYTPLYVFKGDTFETARFNIVPDSINDFLFSCAEKNNFKPLKYSAALIIRHNLEYSNWDYMISDGLIVGENGFLALLRKAMNIGNLNDDFNDPEYFPMNTGEICKWIKDNKKNIIDYKYIDKYKKKGNSSKVKNL